MEQDRINWEEFILIGEGIHRLHGHVRILEAKRALKIAELLVDHGFLMNLSKDDNQLYRRYLTDIAAWLDGNAEIMQAAAREYFRALHYRQGQVIDISFYPKRYGVQSGFICSVSSGSQSIRYFLKTHQYGPTNENIKSLYPPDMKEMFVYHLLHAIGIGPEVHFIIPSHSTNKTIYIATKECNLTALSKVELENATVNAHALLLLDLISRILCLRDCATKDSNCGLVDNEPMIVDFRIDSQPLGYVKRDIVVKFLEGNGEFNYTGLMRQAVSLGREAKLEIMQSALKDWNLISNMDQSKTKIDLLAGEMKGRILSNNDLNRYVVDVKATIAFLTNLE